MKRIFVLFAALLPVICLAQTTANDTFILKKNDTAILETVKLGFAVPDIPAFKSLGLDPSNILRPSEAKDLALSFGSFNSNGNFVIPKNLAIEITPALLFKPWYTLQAYQQKGFLRTTTKTRVSLGSASNEKTGQRTMALGLRTVLIDKADFRTDTTLLKNSLFPLQQNYTLKLNDRIEEVKKKMGIVVYANLTNEARKRITDSIRTALYKENKFDFDKEYDNVIEKYKKENWNAARMDFAYSLVLQSPDSLLGNVKTNKHLFWLVYATRPGKNNHWGQLLFSINNGISIFEHKSYNEFSGNFRFYAGTNRVKGFIEAQYQNINKPNLKRQETLFYQLGAEANFFKGIWVHFGTGVLNALNTNNKSQLVSNLNLYLTIPENLKLF